MAVLAEADLLLLLLLGCDAPLLADSSVALALASAPFWCLWPALPAGVGAAWSLLLAGKLDCCHAEPFHHCRCSVRPELAANSQPSQLLACREGCRNHYLSLTLPQCCAAIMCTVTIARQCNAMKRGDQEVTVEWMK